MNRDRVKAECERRLEELAEHQLVHSYLPEEITERLAKKQPISFYMKRQGTRIMSSLLTFNKEGIVIQGDFVPGGGRACGSDLGYDLAWFVGRLDFDYLACKFLRKTWTREAARDHLQWYVDDVLTELLQEEQAAALVAASVLDAQDEMHVLMAQKRVEKVTKKIDALREILADKYTAAFESARDYELAVENHLYPGHDSETTWPDHAYDEGEAADLWAIQRRFAELFHEERNRNERAM